MKNLFVLPTDKPSRLYYFTANKEGYYLYPNNELVVPRNPNCTNQNIYITSDEEIKVGDYVNGGDWNDIEKIKHQKEVDNLKLYKDGDFIVPYRKIILTTDQDLIKDGVQAIDDEFLEWFIKNPSCEEVEIEESTLLNTSRTYLDIDKYKIIIPKEEPCEHFTPTIGCIKDVCSCNKDPKQAPFKHKVESLSTEEVLANRSNAYEFIDFDKQETLEEAAKECLMNNSLPTEGDFAEGYITGSLFGAKWQQEQILDFLYSEITERRDYSASKMCYKVIEFIENIKKK